MKKTKKFLSYLSLFAVVFSLWVLGGCSKSSDSTPAPTLTLYELVSSSKFKQSATVSADVALDSLAKYLDFYPDLVAVLGGADKYTLFAPSNSAFINLLATPGFPSNITDINPALIEGVLSYHIVAGQKAKSTLTSGVELSTLYSDATAGVQKIVINSDGTLKTGSSNQAIAISESDQLATNGVLHVVASVLIPPTVGAQLTPILGTMAGTILLGADFTDLATIIGVADANFTENSGTGTFKISTWLAMPTANQTALSVPGITFFAVPNAVFQAVAAQMGGGTTEADVVASFTTSADAARGLLLNHLTVTNQFTTSGTHKFSDNATITMKGASSTLAVTTGLTPSSTTGPYGIVFTNNSTPNPSQAYLALQLDPSTNGQVQVIGGILK